MISLYVRDVPLLNMTIEPSTLSSTVKAAWDYPWSSAAYHTGQAETDILVADRTLLGLVEDWQTFLTDAENRQPEALRLATRTGRPAGDPSFIASLEHLTGRTLKPGKRGRPVKSKP